MARRSRPPLLVFLNGRRVGELRRFASGAIAFAYHPDWLAWDHAIPVSLSLPLREERYVGDRVIAVFENLLPDGEIRRRLAERVRADGHDAYGLLTKVGNECVGALQFLPDGAEPGPAGAVEGRPIDDAEVAHKIAHLASSPLGVDEADEFRISLAGAHEKMALLWWKDRWHVPHGTTPTTHILKPQIGRLPNGIDLSESVENEFLCMKMTAALGLPTAEVDITSFADRRVLVVKRFDRAWDSQQRLLRLPQEDCCQALSVPPDLKYQADGGPDTNRILELLKGSDDPAADRRQFLLTQMVFWLLAATDGHAKNTSLFLRAGGRFRLTPVYDVLSAQPARDARQIGRNQMKLALSVGDRRHYAIDEIMPRHFKQTAQANGLPEKIVDELFGELLAGEESAITQVTECLPADFPESLAECVLQGFQRRMRSWQRIGATS